MRVLLQRVSKASVVINTALHSEISKGLVVLWGVGSGDTQADADYLVRKILNMRIFNDAAGKMNLSLKDVRGELLIISQFTLFAQTKRGNRPSFTDAAIPIAAIPLYDYAIKQIKSEGISVKTGMFGATMTVTLTNEGPVTIWLDSKDTVL